MTLNNPTDLKIGSQSVSVVLKAEADTIYVILFLGNIFKERVINLSIINLIAFLKKAFKCF